MFSPIYHTRYTFINTEQANNGCRCSLPSSKQHKLPSNKPDTLHFNWKRVNISLCSLVLTILDTLGLSFKQVTNGCWRSLSSSKQHKLPSNKLQMHHLNWKGVNNSSLCSLVSTILDTLGFNFKQVINGCWRSLSSSKQHKLPSNKLDTLRFD